MPLDIPVRVPAESTGTPVQTAMSLEKTRRTSSKDKKCPTAFLDYPQSSWSNR